MRGEDKNKEVEKPLLLIALPYNALHTPLWYKDRQLHQKLTLSPGTKPLRAVRGERLHSTLMFVQGFACSTNALTVLCKLSDASQV